MDTPARLSRLLGDAGPEVTDAGPVVLDGGLATELEAHGAKLQGDPLWSARLLHTDPAAIREAHHRFLAAGADVITTATYQASVTGFVRHLGASAEAARELLMSSVRLAREAAETFARGGQASGRRRGPLVAGSVGPYGAFLHDGSEYTGTYADQMSIEELKAWHRPQVQCLAAAGADLLALETIPSLKEAEALLELLREFPDSRAWLAFSCRDGRRISDGTLFADAVRVANRSTQLVAVGVNCCAPALVEPLLDSAGSLRSPDMCWVVYPNSGEDWDATLGGWQTSERMSDSVAELGPTWARQGAAMIGGCCRIRPAHIAQIKRRLGGSGPSPAAATGNHG